MIVFNFCCLQRVSQNLHVVLCFTPLSEELTSVCRKFPALVTHMTVSVYDEWTPKALHGVALRHLQDVELQQSDNGGQLLKVHVMHLFHYVFSHSPLDGKIYGGNSSSTICSSSVWL